MNAAGHAGRVVRARIPVVVLVVAHADHVRHTRAHAPHHAHPRVPQEDGALCVPQVAKVQNKVEGLSRVDACAQPLGGANGARPAIGSVLVRVVGEGIPCHAHIPKCGKGGPRGGRERCACDKGDFVTRKLASHSARVVACRGRQAPYGGVVKHARPLPKVHRRGVCGRVAQVRRAVRGRLNVGGVERVHARHGAHHHAHVPSVPVHAGIGREAHYHRVLRVLAAVRNVRVEGVRGPRQPRPRQRRAHTERLPRRPQRLLPTVISEFVVAARTENGKVVGACAGRPSLEKVHRRVLDVVFDWTSHTHLPHPVSGLVHGAGLEFPGHGDVGRVRCERRGGGYSNADRRHHGQRGWFCKAVKAIRLHEPTVHVALVVAAAGVTRGAVAALEGKARAARVGAANCLRGGQREPRK